MAGLPLHHVSCMFRPEKAKCSFHGDLCLQGGPAHILWEVGGVKSITLLNRQIMWFRGRDALWMDRPSFPKKPKPVWLTREMRHKFKAGVASSRPFHKKAWLWFCLCWLMWPLPCCWRKAECLHRGNVLKRRCKSPAHYQKWIKLLQANLAA